MSVKWTSIAELPALLEGFSSVSIPNLGIFIFGGANENMEEQNDVFQYSPTNNDWTKLSSNESKPMGRSCAGFSFNVSGDKVFIYVFGGLNSGVGWLGDIWKGQVDQGKVEWTQIQVPEIEFSPRDKLTCLRTDSDCYLIGGFGPHDDIESEDDEEAPEDIASHKKDQDAFALGWFDEVVKFNFSMDSVESLPLKGVEGAAGKAASGGFVDGQGRIYLFGGKSTTGRTDEMFSFDCESKQWEQEKPGGFPPVARSFFAHAFDGSSFYVFGGQGRNDELLGGLHRYNKGKWSKIEVEGDALAPRRQAKMEVFGDSVYLFGGTDKLDLETGMNHVLKECWKSSFLGSSNSEVSMESIGFKRRKI